MDEAARAPDAGNRKWIVDLLAKADLGELQRFWANLAEPPTAQFLRGPETGLVMVRGRMGGGGAPFNLGEVTVSRATCRLATGEIGHAQALGTSKEKARLAALIDALAQVETRRPAVLALLATIEQRLSGADLCRQQQTAATKVDFFTLVRGED